MKHLNLPDFFSGKPVPGSIFRFPLRSQATKLSENIYTTGLVELYRAKIFFNFHLFRKVRNRLFSSLNADINVVLLFLKHVRKIKIECISRDGKVDVLTHIKKVSTEVDGNGLTKTDMLCIENERKLASFYVLKKRNSNHNQQNLEHLAKKLKVIPEVSIACYKKEDSDKSIPTEYEERVSVMLPLPQSPSTVTGLPVIVNAFFALSENRRVLKWETSDDHSEEVQWNSKILDSLVPECYAELLSRLTVSGCFENTFQFWPRNKISHNSPTLTNWETTAMRTINLLMKKSCLKSLTGNLIAPYNVKDKLSIFTGEGMTEEIKDLFRCILLQFEDEDIVDLSYCATEILSHFQHPNSVFKQCILGPQNLSSLCLRNISVLETFSSKQKNTLLEFIGTAGGPLSGLPLLPLKCDKWTTFQNSCQPKYFLPESLETTSCVPDSYQNIIHIPLELSTLFKTWATHHQYGIAFLDKNLPLVLRESFPASWSENAVAFVNWIPTSATQPSINNIKNIWNYLDKLSDIESFIDLPLMPTKPWRDIGTEKEALVKLAKKNPAVDCSNEGDCLVQLLKNLSVFPVLTYNPLKELSRHLGQFTKKFTPDIFISVLMENKSTKLVSDFVQQNHGEILELKRRL